MPKNLATVSTKFRSTVLECHSGDESKYLTNDKSAA